MYEKSTDNSITLTRTNSINIVKVRIREQGTYFFLFTIC